MSDQEQFFRKSIGKRIKLARAKSSFTQEQLAEKISLSPRYISQLERGLAFGRASTIINVCKALNINSDFLFSDLINNKTIISDNFSDDKFFETYLKLSPDYKEILSIFANDLLKKQTKDEMKTKTK